MKDAAIEAGNVRSRILTGVYPAPPGKNKSSFSQVRYQYLLNAPFEISNRCCGVMKKSPAHSYAHKTGKKPITAQTTDESRLRLQAWFKNGCNGFNMKEPISNPMSFWTEQDILQYIKNNNIPLASIYGEIVEDETGKLRTTGVERTGCMFCGFGCHREKPGDQRFVKMRETHPKLYEYIMKDWEQGGLGFKKVIDWLNENGDMGIGY